jgi:hypothetical protein
MFSCIQNSILLITQNVYTVNKYLFKTNLKLI